MTKQMLVAALGAGLITATAGAAGFTKGREIAPLTPAKELTDLPVSSQTRSEQNFRILTADANPRSPIPP